MYRTLDVLNLIFAACSGLMARVQSRLGPERLPLSYKVWDKIGVATIPFHYYQPVFNTSKLNPKLFSKPDALRGIEWNEQQQLELLSSFHFQEELASIPVDAPATDTLEFFHANPSYGPADAEMLYNMVRHFKPAKVVEIGSGYSTRMLKKALDANKEEGVASKHVCIEPYEMPWLESLGVDEVIRSKVEDVDLEVFQQLQANDILFIDSSHVLRMGGDVFVEYLHILPVLQKGVVVHIHDIFLPYDYPKGWIVAKRRFWTEQYLLQAFLAFNSSFRILAAVNYLALHHASKLAKVCPVFAQYRSGHGSFWMQRV